MNAIEFNNVWKKFKKGEKFNSLRDSIPNLFRQILHKQKNVALEDQEFWAVKDVNFTVKKGEVVGIIGPNGAGKSTILKLLSRIMNPTKGDMKISGRLSALIEVTAGFHPELTGRENLYLNGTILGMKKKELDKKFNEIVEFSGLSEFIDTPVKRYSSGMFSRLGFSVAAHIEPDILLVDEVLSVGDIAFQSKCAKKMRELLKAGTTIMLVSHNLALIQGLCKRVILLDKGEVLKEGDTNEVIPYYQDLMVQNEEDEFRKKLVKSGYKVKLAAKGHVEIQKVSFNDKNFQKRESFKTGDLVIIKVDYIAHQKIECPIFNCKILRIDGVECYSSSTRNAQYSIKHIDGKETAEINLGKIILAPGRYLVEISIWDKEMFHPYIIQKEDILQIDISDLSGHTNAIFIQPVEWRIVKR